MPRCLGTDQSVRASSIPYSAWWALVFQTFWPLTTHSSPSRTAWVVSPARSEPLPGSENSWHHVASPVAVGRSRRDFRSSEPCSRIVGAARPMPLPPAVPTAPTRRNSVSTTSLAAAGRPRPYHSFGQAGQPHPESTRISRRSASDRSGSQLDASQSRTSSATAAIVVGSVTGTPLRTPTFADPAAPARNDPARLIATSGSLTYGR